MPIYEIETPDGRVLEIEGERLPTAEEVQRFSQSIGGPIWEGRREIDLATGKQTGPLIPRSPEELALQRYEAEKSFAAPQTPQTFDAWAPLPKPEPLPSLMPVPAGQAREVLAPETIAKPPTTPEPLYGTAAGRTLAELGALQPGAPEEAPGLERQAMEQMAEFKGAALPAPAAKPEWWREPPEDIKSELRSILRKYPRQAGPEAFSASDRARYDELKGDLDAFATVNTWEQVKRIPAESSRLLDIGIPSAVGITPDRVPTAEELQKKLNIPIEAGSYISSGTQLAIELADFLSSPSGRFQLGLFKAKNIPLARLGISLKWITDIVNQAPDVYRELKQGFDEMTDFARYGERGRVTGQQKVANSLVRGGFGAYILAHTAKTPFGRRAGGIIPEARAAAREVRAEMEQTAERPPAPMQVFGTPETGYSVLRGSEAETGFETEAEAKLRLQQIQSGTEKFAPDQTVREPAVEEPAVPPLIATEERRRTIELMIRGEVSRLKYPVEFTDSDLGGIGTIRDGKLLISRPAAHHFIERELAKGVRLETAIESMVWEEAIHQAGAELPHSRELFEALWDTLTPTQQKAVQRRTTGPHYTAEDLGYSKYQWGQEAARFIVQRAMDISPGEYLALGRGEIVTSKAMTAVFDIIQATRRHILKTETNRLDLEGQTKLIQDILGSLVKAEKGTKYAVESKAAQVLRALREKSEKGAGKVPAEKGRRPYDAGRGKKGLAGQKEVLLSNLPVVKESAPGTIDPDSIVPAIRLINGDVIPGWRGATHPEVADWYGIGTDTLDRKGFTDGKNFYEREPAATGTLLETARKPGELHSTDLPAAKAPPAAPTVRGPPAAPVPTPEVAAVKPGAPVPPAAPAGPTISEPTVPGKVTQVEEGRPLTRRELEEKSKAAGLPVVWPSKPPDIDPTHSMDMTPEELEARDILDQLREEGGPDMPFMARKMDPRFMEVHNRLRDEWKKTDDGARLSAEEDKLYREFIRMAGIGKAGAKDIEDAWHEAVSLAIGSDFQRQNLLRGFQSIGVEDLTAHEWVDGVRDYINRARDSYSTFAYRHASRSELAVIMSSVFPGVGEPSQIGPSLGPMMARKYRFLKPRYRRPSEEKPGQLPLEMGLRGARDVPHPREVPPGTMMPPLTGKNLLENVVQYLDSFIETRPLTKGEIEELERRQKEQVAAGELTTPPTPGYRRPTFRGFYGWVRRNVQGTSPDQVRGLWYDAVWTHLLNASGARLAEWRKALQMESRYGTRDILGKAADMPAAPSGIKGELPFERTERVVGPQLPTADRIARAKSLRDEADVLERMAKTAPTEARRVAAAPPAIQTGLEALAPSFRGEGISPQEAKREKPPPPRAVETGQQLLERAKGLRARADVIEAGGSPEGVEPAKGLTKEQQQLQKAIEYRRTLIGEMGRRLIAEAMPRVKDIGRTEITIDDLDFSNEDTVEGTYRLITARENKDPILLREILSDAARSRENDPLTVTKRLTVMVGEDGVVHALSTYATPSKLMVFEPTGVRVKGGAHRNIRDLLPFYRVRASLLLDEPVQNFHQTWPDWTAFMESLGKDAANQEMRSKEDWAGVTLRVVEAKPAETEEPERFEEGEAPRGLRPEDIAAEAGELPTTRVTRGEGGMVMGPEADVVRAGMGVLRAELHHRSIGRPVTPREANSLPRFLEEQNVKSEKDLERAVETGIRTPENILRGRHYLVIAALDKMVSREFRRLMKEDTSERPKGATYEEQSRWYEEKKARNANLAYHNMLREIYEKYKEVKGDRAAFQREVLNQYGEAAQPTVRPLAAPGVPDVTRAEGVERELTLGQSPWRRRRAQLAGGLSTIGRVFEPPEVQKLSPDARAWLESQVVRGELPSGKMGVIEYEPTTRPLFPENIPLTKGFVGGKKFTYEQMAIGKQFPRQRPAPGPFAGKPGEMVHEEVEPDQPRMASKFNVRQEMPDMDRDLEEILVDKLKAWEKPEKSAEAYAMGYRPNIFTAIDMFASARPQDWDLPNKTKARLLEWFKKAEGTIYGRMEMVADKVAYLEDAAIQAEQAATAFENLIKHFPDWKRMDPEGMNHLRRARYEQQADIDEAQRLRALIKDTMPDKYREFLNRIKEWNGARDEVDEAAAKLPELPPGMSAEGRPYHPPGPGQMDLPLMRSKMLQEVGDEWNREVRVLGTRLLRSKTRQDIYSSLDALDTNTAVRARQSGNSVRLASIVDYTGRLAKGIAEHLPWSEQAMKVRANEKRAKQIREAAKAVIATGDLSYWYGPRGGVHATWAAERTNIPRLIALVDQGIEAAKLMAKGRLPFSVRYAGSIPPSQWDNRSIGRKWLKAAERLKAELQFADANWFNRELRSAVATARKEMHQQWVWEKKNGVRLVSKDLSYVPGRYEAELWNDDSVFFGGGSYLGRNFRAPKSFRHYYEAISRGPYIPVNYDLADLVEHRVRQGSRQALKNQWFEAVKQIKDPVTGRPIVLEPTQDYRQVRNPLTGGTIGVPYGPKKSPSNEYKLVGFDGNRRTLAVRRGYVTAIKAANGESSVRDWSVSRTALRFGQWLKHNGILVYDTYHPMRIGQYALALMGRKVSYKGGWSALEFKEADVPKAVSSGIISQTAADWSMQTVDVWDRGVRGTLSRRDILQLGITRGLNVGRLQDSLYGELHYLMPGLPRLNRWIFDRLTRGLMVETFVRGFEKYNRQHPGTDFNTLMRDLVRDTNMFYGSIGRQGVLKQQWLRDISQIFFLAPQWLEGLAQKEARFYGRAAGAPFGMRTRKGLPPMGLAGSAMAKGLGAYIIMTQAINMVTRGHPTWQNPEPEHPLDAWIPDWEGGPGSWISPGSVFAELSEQLLQLAESKKTNWDAVEQMGRNKLHPWGRVAAVMATKTTGRGEFIPTTAGRLAEMVREMTPVPITFSKIGQSLASRVAPQLSGVPLVGRAFQKPYPGSLERQMLASFAGIKAYPGKTASAQAYKLARKFVADHKLRTPTPDIRHTTDPSYDHLRSAIKSGDMELANHIYRSLKGTVRLKEGNFDTHLYDVMSKYATLPFTGDADIEDMWKSTFTPEDWNLYWRANQERLMDYQSFIKWYITRRSP